MEENGTGPKNNVRNFYFPSNSWLHVFMLPRWKVMTQKVTSRSKNRKGIVKHGGNHEERKLMLIVYRDLIQNKENVSA